MSKRTRDLRKTFFTRRRSGFTIVELLIAVIVIGVLAAAGLAKYQNFAESSRRKTCLFQIQTIENALASWETVNGAFSPLTKSAWGYSTRTGRLLGPDALGSPAFDVVGDTDTSSGADGGLGIAPSVLPGSPLNAQGAPRDFRNDPTGSGAFGGPLNSIIRDDKVWACPSGLSLFYNGEIQNVDDIADSGLRPNQSLSIFTGGGNNIIGVMGRYGTVVVGPGPDTQGTAYSNAALPQYWLTPAGGPSDTALHPTPAPQPPFAITVCGCFGTFGPTTNGINPGTEAISNNNGGGGGPVGANGSALNRHSARW